MTEFRQGPIGPRASNGEYYFTLTHAGRKDEGEPWPYFFIGPAGDKYVEAARKAALDAFKAQVDAEIAAHPGMDVEWRTEESWHLCNCLDEYGDERVMVGVSARLAFVPAMAEAA